MKIHRFIGNFKETGKKIEITDPELVHQMTRVLKLSLGEAVVLGDGNGNEIEGEIEHIEKKKIAVRILSRRKNPNEPSKKSTLYLAILKRDNFELAVQKAVEVGISRIVPILTERTVKSGLNVKRLETIIREAAEQSGRGIVPELGEALPFAEAILGCNPKETVLFDLSGKETFYISVKNLFIGPEGGFTPAEIRLAKEKGIAIGSLGPLTLRGETAAIVGSYLVIHQ